jgi:hypothetical protein
VRKKEGSKMENQVKPEIGMGATECVGSDSYPYSVVEVLSEKAIVVQSDNYKAVSGNAADGSAEYEYSPNPEGAKYVVTLRGNGRWVTKGEGKKSGRGFYVGARRFRYDPHF